MPMTPTGFFATALDYDTIEFRADKDQETTVVYVRTDSGSGLVKGPDGTYRKVGEIKPGATRIEVHGFKPPGTQFKFRARARTSSGSLSAWTRIDSATLAQLPTEPVPPPPPAPSLVPLDRVAYDGSILTLRYQNPGVRCRLFSGGVKTAITDSDGTIRTTHNATVVYQVKRDTAAAEPVTTELRVQADGTVDADDELPTEPVPLPPPVPSPSLPHGVPDVPLPPPSVMARGITFVTQPAFPAPPQIMHTLRIGRNQDVKSLEDVQWQPNTHYMLESGQQHITRKRFTLPAHCILDAFGTDDALPNVHYVGTDDRYPKLFSIDNNFCRVRRIHFSARPDGQAVADWDYCTALQVGATHVVIEQCRSVGGGPVSDNPDLAEGITRFVVLAERGASEHVIVRQSSHVGYSYGGYIGPNSQRIHFDQNHFVCLGSGHAFRWDYGVRCSLTRSFHEHRVNSGTRRGTMTMHQERELYVGYCVFIGGQMNGGPLSQKQDDWLESGLIEHCRVAGAWFNYWRQGTKNMTIRHCHIDMHPSANAGLLSGNRSNYAGRPDPDVYIEHVTGTCTDGRLWSGGYDSNVKIGPGCAVNGKPVPERR